ILNRILPDCDYVIENKKIILVPVKASIPEENDIFQSPQITVTGVISDEFGEVLPGVNINVLGTTQGVVSDLDGRYHVTLPSDATLVFSFVGYTRQTIVVDGQTIINVILKEDTQLMEEVVVVGFAKQKKSNLTGSVSSIKVGEILGDRPVVNTGNLLQGTMPGLQTTIDSGEPGGEYKFNIRGTTSINGG
ncbi:MAG: TonB-dependent receptor, partial [Tannerellaceae bacterium]|nr:TonB-dependent receptor [Tannerellaceae bacterium]